MYQKRAIQFLLDNRFSGLFLDPGLGKTAIFLMYITILLKYFGVKKILIIAPKRVCYITWPDEIKKWEKFQHLTFTILHGKDKAKNLQKDVNIYLINPEGIKWLFSQLDNAKHDFDVLGIDESTKFKNWAAKRTKMLNKMLKYFKRRHILTGTPAPNGLIDLFAQIFIIDIGETFGKAITRFREAYFNHDKYTFTYTIKDGMDQIIHEKVAPVVLQMSADEYLSLPELLYNKIYVDMDAKSRSIYEDLEKRLFAEIDSQEINLVNGSAAYNACKQVASGALYHQNEYFPSGIKVEEKTKRGFHILHNEKIEALEDLLDTLGGKPLLIAYAFNHDLERLLDKWPKTRYIGKGVSDEEAIKIVHDWNKGLIDKLFVHPASMSHGLNMQAVGRDVCWFSLTDNLEEYDQLIRRLYRQGVSGSVRVHHLMVKNTTDEVMYSRNLQKGNVQNTLRDALANYRDSKENNL